MDTTERGQDYFPLSSLSNRITFCRHNASDGAPHTRYQKGPLLVKLASSPNVYTGTASLMLIVVPVHKAAMPALSYDFAFMRDVYNLKSTNLPMIQSFCRFWYSMSSFSSLNNPTLVFSPLVHRCGLKIRETAPELVIAETMTKIA